MLWLAFLCCGWRQSWDEEEVGASSTGAVSCPALPFARLRARVKSWQSEQWGRMGATFLFRSAGFSWTWGISCSSCCYLFHHGPNWSFKCGTAEGMARQKPMCYINTCRQHSALILHQAWQEAVMEQREAWREGGLKWHKEIGEGRAALGVQEGYVRGNDKRSDLSSKSKRRKRRVFLFVYFLTARWNTCHDGLCGETETKPWNLVKTVWVQQLLCM